MVKKYKIPLIPVNTSNCYQYHVAGITSAFLAVFNFPVSSKVIFRRILNLQFFETSLQNHPKFYVAECSYNKVKKYNKSKIYFN